jgi:hypothetical protein
MKNPSVTALNNDRITRRVVKAMTSARSEGAIARSESMGFSSASVFIISLGAY